MPDNKLFILCGIPFSGKTTLAQKLTQYTDFTRIDLDVIKFAFFKGNISDDQIGQSDWDKIYQQMYLQIETALRLGKNVIHDTGNFTRNERKIVQQIADKLDIETLTIFINTPKEVAYQRLLKNREIKQRFDVSDLAFESSCLEMEPPNDSEPNVIYDGVNCPDFPIQSYLL